MKRIVSIVILMSMMLHCASRLGVISYLYETRHDIAYHVGLIAETPIAVCSGDYFGENGPLVIHEANSDDTQQAPAQIATAKEITLFSQIACHLYTGENSTSALDHNTFLVESFYSPPDPDVFHPPC